MTKKRTQTVNLPAHRVGTISHDERIAGARAYVAYVRASKRHGSPIVRFESWLNEWIEVHRKTTIETPAGADSYEPQRDFTQMYHGKKGYDAI